MRSRRPAQPRLHRLVLPFVLAASLLAPTLATAADDTTAPVGTVEIWDHDGRTITFHFEVSDENGIAGVRLSCDDGATWIDRPFAPILIVPTRETGLGCVGFTDGYDRLVQIEVRDPSGNVLSLPIYVILGPWLDVTLSTPAVTGHSMTITPVLPDGYTIPGRGGCRWEFRWGDDRSLANLEHNETFGSMLFDIPAVAGRCKPWTFALPWVPVRQYEVYVSVFTIEPDGGTSLFLNEMRTFTASVDSTERRITHSSLPVVQVLPSTYTPIVGQPITYTRYLIGGATDCCSPRWTAWQGEGDHPNQWNKNGGSTFTITPFETGNILVGWDRATGDWRLGALYDPPVRYRDRTKPTTSAPIQVIGGTQLGATVPVTLNWSASDVGWGISSYRLEQSVAGGPWKVALASTKARSVVRQLTPNVPVRFRVRATDKGGNVGDWDYGPTFRPWVAQEGSATLAYAGAWSTVADATASGGQLRESDVLAAQATFTFTGRDVGWFAERGPGHGTAKVYADGVLITTINLAAATDTPRTLVFRRHWTTAGHHVIRVVVLGTGIVDVDAFTILR